MSTYPAYTYAARLLGIHDADTLHCTVDLGCDVAINMRVRLYGVNAPELRTAEGKLSRAWVADWFLTHCPDGRFVIQTRRDSKEKYGRYLGVIFPVGGTESLNDGLVGAGHAVPYVPT